MTFLSARRILPACVVSAAAVAALAAPGAASASDLGEQCSGGNVEALGSSFQAPAQKVWETGAVKGFNVSTNLLACAGTQGDKKTPSVKYNQEESPINNKGSGACLKDLGSGLSGTETTRKKQFPFCGTDEAPNTSQKKAIEEHTEQAKAEERNVLSIPVAQGAVAVIVNLPEHCTATSEVTKGLKLLHLKRLSLDASTVEAIYKGGITTWAGVEAVQGAGHANDKITCTPETNKNERIHVVVRRDKSGTTHIFKSWLAQLDTEEIAMEPFNEPEGGGKKPCSEELPEQKKTWKQVQEGCENQRWPTAAEIVRPPETGNGGVINQVANHPSSIGYADLAVAREKKFFSAKGLGGEGKARFWAEVSNNPESSTPTYADPSSNGDTEKPANSNCAKTNYIGSEKGEKIPPANTRELWSGVKASPTEETYGICGVTYMLAFRQYFPALAPEGLTAAESLERAQTVHDYLQWVLNTKAEGGSAILKGHDYEKLPKTMQKIAEEGVKEIGNEKA